MMGISLKEFELIVPNTENICNNYKIDKPHTKNRKLSKNEI